MVEKFTPKSRFVPHPDNGKSVTYSDLVKRLNAFKGEVYMTGPAGICVKVYKKDLLVQISQLCQSDSTHVSPFIINQYGGDDNTGSAAYLQTGYSR